MVGEFDTLFVSSVPFNLTVGAALSCTSNLTSLSIDAGR